MTTQQKKKLIEVALPLEAINRACQDEKAVPRRGHPQTIHLWWARRPLAACRAVLFASLVDDPSVHPERFPTEEAQDTERQRLFRIIEDLVKWENSNDARVLGAARKEILTSTGGAPPLVCDPFCGGGSIPLEAQRLGLEAYASDLNPVAVLITKALIEIPPRFAGRPPVNHCRDRGKLIAEQWKGAAGLAEDVRRYGQWMREAAETRIGKLYPKVRLPKQESGGEAMVIAWLWARTVNCPNPACGAQMPLVRSFSLSTRKGKEAHVMPVVSGNTYRFEVRKGSQVPSGTVSRRGAHCVCCKSPVPLDHVRAAGRAGRMKARLMAIAAEGPRGRIYLSPNDDHERIAASAKPAWVPETELPEKALSFRVQVYGMTRHADLFTSRQLVALTTLSELVGEVRKRVLADALSASFPDDATPLNAGGSGARAYAECVGLYLSLALSKLADWSSTLCGFIPGYEKFGHTFGKQALPMIWDFAELNVFSEAVGNWTNHTEWVARAVEATPATGAATVELLDASDGPTLPARALVCTDPPYYDNIGYADLSDFFYAWLRPTLKEIYPRLMGTVQVPKECELVATPHRFGGDKDKAREFFERGLGRAFKRMHEAQDSNYPLTLYYAFKQAETEDNGKGQDGSGRNHASTGWETMLDALLRAEFSIHGTWPMRTERLARSVGIGTNALASSVVLVCRPRPVDAPVATRGDFLRALKGALPQALRQLQHGNIAPVDLAQAAIGPGMAVFSRYSKVLDTKGEPVRVREALALINQVLDEVLAEQEGDFDSDSRWAVAWFEQSGFDQGEYGAAETLSKAKNTSVSGMVDAGILVSKGGKVRLLRPADLPPDWDPTMDPRLTAWEVVHHLVRVLEAGGESAAAELVSKLGTKGEVARELAYRLYTLCERKKRAQEALSYNGLVQSWPEITRLAREGRTPRTHQAQLFEQE